jgi:cyclopropane fatty-acyl-phospholipid synthase-like methyltransferase
MEAHYDLGNEFYRLWLFRRELCVDVSGVAKAFPREVAAGRTARLRGARRLWEYYSYCEAGFRSGMIDVGLYSIQHRRA